jgi:hypothetical protein
MNKSVLILLVLLSTFRSHLDAQVPGLSLLGTGGGMTQNGSTFLSYSFGETLISYHQNGNQWITEGFQQPEKINLTTAIKHLYNSFNLLLFPNPAENRLNLTSPELEKCQQIQIINTLGQIQFQTRIHSTDQVSLSIDELVPGLYLIHLSCMDGIIMTQSFIKQ